MKRLRQRQLSVSALLLIATGCGSERACPPNQRAMGDRCVPLNPDDPSSTTSSIAQPPSDPPPGDEDTNGGVEPTQDLGDALPICINELVVGNDRSLDVDGTSPDWIELHNPTGSDVSLAGWSISDDVDEPDQHLLDPDLVVPAGGYLVLLADADPEAGPRHLSFKLAIDGETLVLTAPSSRQSQIIYPALEDDIAALRSTNCCTGEDCWTYTWFGTPEASNIDLAALETEEQTLLEAGSSWRYWDVGDTPAPDWVGPEHDDSSWSEGPAPLGYGDDHILTVLDYGEDRQDKPITTYFRSRFTVVDASRIAQLELSVMRDDGAVVYLNGTEVGRLNLPDGALSADTTALLGVSSTDETTFFTKAADPTLLVTGENVVAVAVHQISADSADLGMDLAIHALATTGTEAKPEPQPWVMIEELPPYEPLLPRPCAPIYDQDVLPEISIEIDEDEWAGLELEYANYGFNRDGELKPYHPLLSFTVGDEVIENAEIRLKGNPCCSWLDGEKLQFTFRFDGIDDAGRFQGLRHIALDGPYYEPSALRERLAMSYFREDLEVPASCVNNARLVVNGEFYGLYANIEFLDEELLERLFGNGGPDEGLLFKYDYTMGEWECKEGADEDNLSGLNELYDLVDPMEIEDRFDLETYLHTVAGEAIIPSEDNYFSGSINFAWYRHPDRGWMLLPWDHDWTFMTETVHPYAPGNWADLNGHIRILLDDPNSAAQYDLAVQAAQTAYDPAVLSGRLDRWSAQIADSVDEDPWLDSRVFELEVSRLQTFVWSRRNWLDERFVYE